MLPGANLRPDILDHRPGVGTAAHGAAEAWGRTNVAERSGILLKIADRMEANLEDLVVVADAVFTVLFHVLHR